MTHDLDMVVAMTHADIDALPQVAASGTSIYSREPRDREAGQAAIMRRAFLK